MRHVDAVTLLQGGLDNLLKGAATQCLQVTSPSLPHLLLLLLTRP